MTENAPRHARDQWSQPMASPFFMVSHDKVPADVGKSNDLEKHGEQ